MEESHGRDLLTTTTFRDTVLLVLHVTAKFVLRLHFLRRGRFSFDMKNIQLKLLLSQFVPELIQSQHAGLLALILFNYNCMEVGTEFDTDLRRGLNCFH